MNWDWSKCKKGSGDYLEGSVLRIRVYKVMHMCLDYYYSFSEAATG